MRASRTSVLTRAAKAADSARKDTAAKKARNKLAHPSGIHTRERKSPPKGTHSTYKPDRDAYKRRPLTGKTALELIKSETKIDGIKVS